MEWLPMCAELEMAVGACNWLDMVVLYCQKFSSEHQEFAINMSRLVGEMNEACQDRIAFVRELESVAGVTVMAKTIVFLKQMMDKEGSREWQLCDLVKEAKERALEIELFVQKMMCDTEDLRLAREINALCARVTAIIDERENFVDELDILVGRSVPAELVANTLPELSLPVQWVSTAVWISRMSLTTNSPAPFRVEGAKQI
ncbi:hypothetical protein Tco_1481989 [Tanacetum coccineum]